MSRARASAVSVTIKTSVCAPPAPASARFLFPFPFPFRSRFCLRFRFRDHRPMSSAVSPSHLASAIERVQSPASGVQVDVVYSTHSKWPQPTAGSSAGHALRVSVLDSSFNPPTRAHLALARTAPQGAHRSSEYDAHLLLFSVRNVDKTLKLGDASPVQRLQMMIHLARDLESHLSSPNVAVAVIDEPTFVGKATKLLAHFHNASIHPAPLLTFIVGYDTLTRLFAPQYYPPERTPASMRTAVKQFFWPGGANSSVVCARRPTAGGDANPDEKAFLESADVAGYVRVGKIRLVDISDEERHISSTAVRNGVAAGSKDWEKMCTPSIVEFVRNLNVL
ncbi:hypothetical protein BOTBODRAFT_332390 [Botryobasidium botryosum FD-172 SS1]|uniref:Nicotinamide-nucleotide adenylyltransferase n=1 Tax=Botryobasidium botryosum (strain FD-172 SS1) TaxID=930990 RepID=A0A067MHA8_BOTB1|nr:hypothetical protein BOTBODRAFT_332390 [Botryobasidium botryosum FD-172 SS1]